MSQTKALETICRENDMLRQQMSHSSLCRETDAHTFVMDEGSYETASAEALRESQQRGDRLASDLAHEISRGEQVLP